MNLKKTAKEIIDNNLYLSLATTDGKTPWNAALFYAVDKNYNFYCVSSVNSLHIKNIIKNSKIAITIFDSTLTPEDVNGVQIEGDAYLIKPSEIIVAAKPLYSKRFKDKKTITKYLNPKLYLGKSKLSLFKIVPKHIYVLDTKDGKEDDRVEVNIIDD